MKNNGRIFEQLVAMIQESLKDSPQTQVFHNCYIEDITPSKKKRQFDIIIKSKINGFENVIAIECKDYSSPVTLEKIEAFNSKCTTIANINKKILISAQGFQSGAIENAIFFNIELFQLSKINISLIKDWIDLEGIRKISGTQHPLKYIFVLNNNTVVEAGTISLPFLSQVTTKEGIVTTLEQVIINTLEANDDNILTQFTIGLDYANLANLEREVNFYRYFIIKVQRGFMWLDREFGGQDFITEFRVLLEFKLEVKKTHSTVSREFKKLNGSYQANTLSLTFNNDNTELHIIKTKDSDDIDAYFIDISNKVIKFDKGFTLDTETGEITDIRINP